MSYLSLISCTDRGILWVATRMRSAYSSVSKRETSFSRIALDSAVDTNRSIYPVLEFDTCRVAIANPIVHRKSGSNNRPQFRPGHPGRPVPGHVEQLRIRLRAVQDHGAVDYVQMKHDPCEVLQFRGGGALRGDEPDEDVFRSADRREDPGHLLQDFLLVHGLEGVEGHEGQERPLRLRELEFHVRPLQIGVDARALHVEDRPRDVGGAQRRRLEHADLVLERPRREVGTDELPEEVRAPFPRRHVRDPASQGDEVADDRGPKPVDVIGGDRVRDLEGDDATAVEAARQSVEGLEPETHRVFREVLDGLPGLRLHGSDLLVDIEGGETAAVQREQVPVLLDLLSAQLLDREDAKAAALVLRRGEAHDPVPEVVEAGLPAALEDVQYVLAAPFDEIFLEDRDEPRRGDAVVLREGIDRIDEHEGPLGSPVVHEVVGGLELRQIETEGDLEEIAFHLATPDRLGFLILAFLPLLELPFELVEREPRDFRRPLRFRTRLKARGLDPILEPRELAVQRFVGDTGAQVMGGGHLAEFLRELEGERRLPGSRGPFHDEGVPSGGVEELDDLARDATDRGRHGTGSKQRARLYISFRRVVICEPVSLHRVRPESGWPRHPSSEPSR